MLIDSKWVITEDSAHSEDLATSTTTGWLSDSFDLKAVSGWADGGGEVFLVLRCKSTTAAVGASFTLSITDCATVGGTYVSKVDRVILLAEVVANTIVAKIALPKGIREFVKVKMTVAASMTGAFVSNAAFVTE